MGDAYDPARFLAPIAVLFDHRLKDKGANAQGVAWQTAAEQLERFEILARILDGEAEGAPVSVADLGCGYGALFTWLDAHAKARVVRYQGYDIAETMVETAREHIQDPRATFTQSARVLAPTDYAFASGPFNFRNDVPDADWNRWVADSLIMLSETTTKGLAANFLAPHPDLERPEGLWEADPEAMTAFCRKYLSKDVECVQDYGMAEFTLLVHF